MSEDEEKLNALILLIRKAWCGDKESIDRISLVVGIPAPKITPQTQAQLENKMIAQNYLKLTSNLLDEQLAEDKKIKQNVTRLKPRPKTATGVINRTRPKSSPIIPQINYAEDKEENILSAKIEENDMKHGTSNLPMSDLTDLVPLFKTHEAQLSNKKENTQQNILDSGGRSTFNKEDIFNPNGIVGSQKVRPVSAALQRRQDYIRSHSKTRPRTAVVTPAFKHATEEDFNEIIVSSREVTPTPRLNDNSARRFSPEVPPMSINISDKKLRFYNGSRDRITDRQPFPFGDVSDALHRVQEMERLFRQNTKRLQQKIGVSPKGMV